jgi:hypothetical protein
VDATASAVWFKEGDIYEGVNVVEEAATKLEAEPNVDDGDAEDDEKVAVVDFAASPSSPPLPSSSSCKFHDEAVGEKAVDIFEMVVACRLDGVNVVVDVSLAASGADLAVTVGANVDKVVDAGAKDELLLPPLLLLLPLLLCVELNDIPSWASCQRLVCESGPAPRAVAP